MSQKIEYVQLSGKQWGQIQAALKSSRGYVECCCEPDGSDGASAALKELDAAAAMKPLDIDYED